MQTRKQEECLLADKIKTEIFLIEDTESEKFLAESEDSIQNELFHDEEKVQESLLADDIKPEILLNENIGNEKFQAESGDSIKNELCSDEEQTWRNLELATDRDCIKIECEVLDDKENYDQIKKEIDDTEDSFEVEPSDQVYDHVIKEEFEIENATYPGDMTMNENSSQSCTNDTEDSFQSGKGVPERFHYPENGDQIVHSDERQSKSACDESLPNHVRAKHHVKHTNETITSKSVTMFQCDICDFSAKTKKRLKSHTDAVHLKLKTFECAHCSYKGTIKSNLRLHIEAKHLNKQFKCDICDFSTIWRGYIQEHYNRMHPNNTTLKLHKNFMCSLCDFGTAKRYLLKKHVDRVHMQLRRYECTHCEYKTAETKSLRNHVDRYHNRTGPFKCNRCDFSTALKQNLKIHCDSEHSKEDGSELLNKFRCHLCGFCATTDSELKDHLDGVHLTGISLILSECEDGEGALQ